jgi:hypothetical protein
MMTERRRTSAITLALAAIFLAPEVARAAARR